MTALFWLLIIAGVVYYLFNRKNIIAPALINLEQTKDSQPYVFKPTEVNKKIIMGLLYLAKADGQTRQDELDIIANFLVRMQPEHQNTPTYYITTRIKEDIKPYSTEEYKKFIDQLDKPSLENLMTWMNSIFGTQKKNHPYEDILINELKNKIASSQDCKTDITKCRGCSTPIPAGATQCPMCTAPVAN